MPARTAPVVVKRIRHLRRQGLQIGAIAREVGVGRGTVAKYVKKVDGQAELEDVVGGLTAAQQDNLMRLVDLPIETIEALAGAAATHRCPCGEGIVYLPSAERFRCATCGELFRVEPAQAAPPKPKAAPDRHPPVRGMRPLRRGRG